MRDGADARLVRFSLYRSTAAQFYLDSGAVPGASLDYAHDVKKVVPFGTPGDIGLACPHSDPENPPGYRVFANGVWFLSAGRIGRRKEISCSAETVTSRFCADFDGDGIADNGVFRDGRWYICNQRASGEVTTEFGLGTGGDRPVVLNVAGAGNETDRRNVVYGVYRQGTWYLDRNGDGVVDATHTFADLHGTFRCCFPAGRWMRRPRMAIRSRSSAMEPGM